SPRSGPRKSPRQVAARVIRGQSNLRSPNESLRLLPRQSEPAKRRRVRHSLEGHPATAAPPANRYGTAEATGRAPTPLVPETPAPHPPLHPANSRRIGGQPPRAPDLESGSGRM